MNGGIEVILFNNQLQPETSDKLRDNFGMSSERIRKEFGTISEAIMLGADKNIENLNNISEAVVEQLNNDFGITSDKLRISFGKASDNKIPNPILVLILIFLFPEITADEIGQLIGVSSRSADTYIQKLKKEELIERVGGKKEGVWQIKIMRK